MRNAIEANRSQHKPNRAKQPGKAGDHILLVERSLNHSRIRLNVIDHQVRIDFGQRLLHLHENVRGMPRRPDHDVVEILRPKLVALEIPLIEMDGLSLGDVVHDAGLKPSFT